MTAEVLVKNFHTISKSDSKTENYYRLRININGFKLEDLKIELLVNNKKFNPKPVADKSESVQQKDKVQVKINGKRTSKQGNVESTREYEKYYDILTKSNIDVNSIKYYLDPKNDLFLIVEFLSNTNEDVYVNLDDSLESLVETAAKSLLNIQNIEDLKSSLTNASNPANKTFQHVFSPSLINDINQASKTRLTPVQIVENSNGTKIVRVSVEVPMSIKSASCNNWAIFLNNSEFDEKKPNHLDIKYTGCKLILEALTSSENSTSTFSKEINLPKGTKLDELKFNLDQSKHSLSIEAPYSNLVK